MDEDMTAELEELGRDLETVKDEEEEETEESKAYRWAVMHGVHIPTLSYCVPFAVICYLY